MIRLSLKYKGISISFFFSCSIIIKAILSKSSFISFSLFSLKNEFNSDSTESSKEFLSIILLSYCELIIYELFKDLFLLFLLLLSFKPLSYIYIVRISLFWLLV